MGATRRAYVRSLSGSAKIKVIGVFVHIEREDRPSARKRMAVIGSPLIDEFAIVWRP